MEHGINVSTQVIADKLGISGPALFKRFGTKRELILAALAPPAQLPVTKWIESGPREGEFEPQFEELLHKLWETLKWIFPRIMLLKDLKIDVDEFHKRYKTVPFVHLLMCVAGWFHRAAELQLVRQDGNKEFWAQSCLGTLQGRAVARILMRVEFGPENDEEYIRSVMEVLSRGMKLEA